MPLDNVRVTARHQADDSTETWSVGPRRRLPARVIGLSTLAMFTGSACAPSPSCATGPNPSPVTITLDARGWLQEHPAAATFVACVLPSQCKHVPAQVLQHSAALVGSVFGSLPGGAPVKLSVRVLNRSGKVLIMRSASATPTIDHQRGPCGDYDVVSAPFTLDESGELAPSG